MRLSGRVRFAAAALVVLAACADNAVVPPMGGSLRLSLQPVARPPVEGVVADESSAPRKTLAFLEPARSPDEWLGTADSQRIELARTSVEPDEHVECVAFRFSSDNKSVYWRGQLDASRINEADVYMLASDAAYVTVELVDNGKIIATTSTAFYPSSPTAFHVVQPFLWPLPEKPDCDAVIVRINGEAKQLSLISVALNDRRPSSYAPEVAAGEVEFSFDGLTSAGHWISTERPLEARARVPENSALAFRYLQPRRARRHGAEASIVVKVTGGGQVLERRLSLEAAGIDPSSWHREKLSLAQFGAADLRFEFRVEASSDSAAFLANAAVVMPLAHKPPSVLLVTSDTHRADHVGAAGSGVAISTPALDALIERGVYFTDCLSTANSTNPSHSALMTGVHTRDTGVLDNATPLTAAAPTLAEAFRALGYRTLAVVSAEHLGPDFGGFGQGFDVFSTPPPGTERSAQDTVDRALDLLVLSMDEPVFMWVHVFDAHAPYAPPPAFDRSYYATKDRDPFDPNLPALGIDKHKLAPELQGLGDLEFPRAQYKAEISHLDSQLARLFDAERFKAGVTAFVADHGESLGEHGIYFDHSGLFPQCVRVPLVLAWPGAPAGTRTNARVMHTDLGSTLLALAGAPHAEFPGRDLTETLGAVAPEGEGRRLRFMISGNFTSAAVEDGTHYLILTLADPADPRLDMQTDVHRAFLYDLVNDPGCTVDVSERDAKVTRRLRAALIEWLSARRHLGWAGGRLNDPAFLEQLSRLGYVSLERPDDKPLWVDDKCDWCRRY